MNKEKTSYNETSTANLDEKLADPSSSKDTYMEKMKAVYLPKSQDEYHPSEESIEHVNDLTSAKSNPVKDAISRRDNS
jgi:hypothetical protein